MVLHQLLPPTRNARHPPLFRQKSLTLNGQRYQHHRGGRMSLDPQKKRKRRKYDEDSSIISSSTSTTSKSKMTSSSQQPECHCSNTTIGCDGSDSMATPSSKTSIVLNAHQHNERQHIEEQSFVHCKPFRLTKFQWSRVNKYQFSSMPQATTVELEGEDKDQRRLDREVELAVSSNLIFNIALTHHLIALSQGQEKKACQRLLRDNDDSEDEFHTDDENACEYECKNSSGSGSSSSGCSISSCSSFHSSEDESMGSNFLLNKERLRGALRLYELGFRIHTKRVAYVTALQTASSTTMSIQSFSSAVTSSFISTTTTAMTDIQGDRLPPPPLRFIVDRSISSSSSSSSFSSQATESSPPSSQFILRSDREAELKSTARFAMALLNNCAHVHDKLGQVKEAKKFQERLLSFLMVIIDSGESIHDILGDEPAVDGYLKNLFNGTVFNTDTAPAAVA
mmetsp:Transcript_16733/g.38631  ORF Transcript_16733/g.38631 Transcript_16733/m.38631 type:complete len:453 (+) Transcript_16733:469-1827(+)